MPFFTSPYLEKSKRLQQCQLGWMRKKRASIRVDCYPNWFVKTLYLYCLLTLKNITIIMKVQEKKTNKDLRVAKKLKGVYKHCINILSSSPNARHIVKNIEAKMKSI